MQEIWCLQGFRRPSWESKLPWHRAKNNYVGNITQAMYTIYLTKLFKIIYCNVRFLMLDDIDQITPRT